MGGGAIDADHPESAGLFQTTHSLEANVSVAYMVMDYVEGGTLADYIQTTSKAGKFPSAMDIVRLFASISKALDFAHQEGMIHRDIKPANILLDKRHAAPNSIGEPVLTDFGIAKIVGASSDTISGTVLGTVHYISPEQAQGDPVTERSDIYSLGVILYEICTGVCPFQSGNVPAILMQHMHAAPILPDLINPAIPPALTTVILRAIAKDPAERPRNAMELQAAIQLCRGALARRSTVLGKLREGGSRAARRLWSHPQRRKSVSVALVALLLASQIPPNSHIPASRAILERQEGEAHCLGCGLVRACQFNPRFNQSVI